MKKFILSIITLIAFLPSIVLAEELTPDYEWYGTGVSTTYEISDVDDLLGFANIVNGKAEGIEKDTFKDKTVNLTNDIDLTDVVWTPIGTSMYDHSPEDATTKMFEGTFDGRYHTINGLSSKGYTALAEDISSGEHSYGLFGYAYGASFKNLNLTNVDIHCSGDAGADGSGIAAAVGFYVVKDKAVSVIDNVNLLSGKVQATNNMGGIIGYMETNGTGLDIDITIKNCTNNAEVVTDAREAGGILGLFQNADRCTGTLKFINCINNGNITAENGANNSVAGGILGKEQSYGYYEYEFFIHFENCINNGTITANGRAGSENHAGGMGTSFYTRGAPVVMNNCVNTGDIIITGPSTANFISGLYAHPQMEENNDEYGIVQNSSYSTGKLTYPTTSTVIIIYDINGGTGVEAATRSNTNANVKLGSGTQVTREGYKLIGWNTKIDGTGTHYELGSTIKPSESLILYAEWRKEKTTWSIANIAPQKYTGSDILPTVLVYDENNNLIDSSKYTIKYNTNSINVGKYTLTVTYNNETIEMDYEIIKSRVDITLTPKSKVVNGTDTIELIVSGATLNSIEIICNKEVTIKDNGDNTFTITVPNESAKYLFRAVSKDNANHFSTTTTTEVEVTKVESNEGGESPSTPAPDKEEEKNPETSDNITKIAIMYVISVVGLITTLYIKKRIN